MRMGRNSVASIRVSGLIFMPSGTVMSNPIVQVGERPNTIEEIVAVAGEPRVSVALSRDPAFTEKIAKGAARLEELWRRDQAIYGVTTGLGDSCVRRIPPELVPELSRQLALNIAFAIF